MEQKRYTEWHLDKRLPVAIVLALVTNTITFTWWASGLDHQVNQNKTDIAANKNKIEGVQKITEEVAKQGVILQGLLDQIKELRKDIRQVFKDQQQ